MTSILAWILRNKWTAVIAVWQTSAVLFILHRYFNSLIDPRTEVKWGSYVASMEALHIAWILITVPLFRYLSKNLPRSWWQWFILSIAVTIIHSVLTTVLFGTVLFAHPQHLGHEESDLIPRLVRLLASLPIISWITAAIVLFIFYFGYLLFRYETELQRSSLLEAKLSTTKLEMFRMQVNPHFIFNSLNTVSMMIRTGMHSEANVMTAKIAGLFRKFLEYDSSQLVTVAEEVSLVKDYLDVESLRFRDKLNVSIEVDEPAKKMQIPNLILQPLIENAFKHGATQILGVFTIEIAVKLDQKLCITVVNDGILHSDMKEGIGMSNIRSRLALLYGDNATFTIRSVDKKVVAEIQIPI